MHRLMLMPLIGSIGVGATLIAGAAPREDGPRYLLTDREAFVMSDADLVAAPTVTATVWSPDSRYLLIVRQEKPSPPASGPIFSGALSLIAWNRGTGRARVIWQRPAGLQMINQVEWLPGTDAALMVLQWAEPSPTQPEPHQLEPHKTLFWMDAAHGVTRPLTELHDEQLLISPAQPQAALYSQDHHVLRVAGASGSIDPGISVPQELTIDRWAPDGSVLYGVTWEGPGTQEQPAHPKWHSLDPQTGRIADLASPPPTAPEKLLPVHLRSTSTLLKEENTSQRISPLWLESAVKSDRPRLLVCADGDGGSLAPDAGAVLYFAHGAAWVAPLTRMPREQMLAQLHAAQRQVALSNARQIGLALMMYAQDYDETYPPPDGNASQVLLPYLKNKEVLNAPGTDEPGFVYTYPGGTIKSIANPSAQELGYVSGPGGRAVIYADGHAKWQSDSEGPGEPAVERRRSYFR